MVYFGTRPPATTHDEETTLTNLWALSPSLPGQFLQKTGATTFQNAIPPGSGGGGVWGTITGTLSNQTDLQNALNALQPTITLTTTGTSGAATFASNVLNIPQYSGGGSPGGADTQVQYNQATAFGGSSNFTYDYTDSILTVNGYILIAYGSSGYFSNNQNTIAGRVSEGFGQGTNVQGHWNTGIGGDITLLSSQFRSTALGYGASAAGNDGTAIGYLASATAQGVAIGSGANAALDSTVAIGANATLSNGSYIAIGPSVTASGSLRAMAIGKNVSALGFGTIAIGADASASGNGSIVINSGYTAIADTASNQLIIAGGNWPITDIFFGYGVSSGSSALTETIHGTSGLGTDIAGSNLILAAGQSTGAGTAGILQFKTAPVGSSGTSLNNLVTRVTIDGAGNSIFATTINSAIAQTTYTGSVSGTAVWSMPFQGSSYKKFVIYFSALHDAGGTITFPTAFTKTPFVYGDSAATAVSSASTTTFTIAIAATITGNVFVEGY